jgi:hypothetical protein
MLLKNIQNTLAQKGFTLYTRPFELNIVGVRANSNIPNTFNDTINVFFVGNNGGWLHYSFNATTDPGLFWLQNPLSPQGTAILKPGHYPGSHQLGLHRGKYIALVQRKVLPVMRDAARNGRLNFSTSKVQVGMFGINIHRATANGTSLIVDKYSAGCQVIANSGDFAQFMQLCETHKRLYGNSFTYTLIDETAAAPETNNPVKKNPFPSLYPLFPQYWQG